MSMLVRTTAVIFALAIGSAPKAQAGLIDFESFSSFQNITGMDLGGVRLYSQPNGQVTVYDNTFGLGSNSGTNCIADPSFGQFNRIVGVFDNPQSHVLIWGGNSISAGISGWSLEVFDAPVGGNSIGISTMGAWSGTPYVPLQVDVPGIMRFEAALNPGTNGIGFDDLEFTPEPASLILAAGGALGFRRRRAF